MAAKMARWIIKKAFLLLIFLALFDSLVVDAQGNNTSGNNTTEGPGDSKTVPVPTPKDSSSSSFGRKFLLVMAGIATLAAVVICCHISSKSKSNYATGGNLPKPMVDLSAKF